MHTLSTAFGTVTFFRFSMAVITYISGGERSGKSTFGMEQALGKSDNPVYLATATRLDADFSARIDRHQQERKGNWELIEEPVQLDRLNLKARIVLLDCITLWLSNIFFSNKEDKELSIDLARTIWDRFTQQEMELVVISNEIGMGVHGTTPTIRAFVEIQGWMNQYIAKQADEAFLMVSGIPLKLK